MQMWTDKSVDPVLDLSFKPLYGPAGTVRSYLIALLTRLLEEGEGFSGKRPFGMGGWQSDLYLPLVKAGFITGKLDENGYIEDCDQKAGDRIILEAIKRLH